MQALAKRKPSFAEYLVFTYRRGNKCEFLALRVSRIFKRGHYRLHILSNAFCFFSRMLFEGYFITSASYARAFQSTFVWPALNLCLPSEHHALQV